MPPSEPDIHEWREFLAAAQAAGGPPMAWAGLIQVEYSAIGCVAVDAYYWPLPGDPLIAVRMSLN
jgi:hypothetical protein